MGPGRYSRRIGETLLKAREKLGKSQEDLARELGYGTAQVVSDWERGAAGIPMKNLLKVAKALQIHPDELFEQLLQFSRERLEESMRERYAAASGSQVRRKTAKG